MVKKIHYVYKKIRKVKNVHYFVKNGSVEKVLNLV